MHVYLLMFSKGYLSSIARWDAKHRSKARSLKQEYKKRSGRLAHIHYNITKCHNPVSLCFVIR